MNNSNVLIEIAAFTPGSAIVAATAGADRIELCSGYAEGGLSPSTGTILYVREKVNIPVFVMIRPRVGDFVYDDAEKEIILRDIEFCKSAGINGIVTGALDVSGNVDKSFMMQVVDTAGELPVTFHRAFDLSGNLQQALIDLIDCGLTRVLTAGGKNSVPDGLETIRSLIKTAGNQIIILPGGGINASNVKKIVTSTGLREIHCSGKELIRSRMQPKPGISLATSGEVSDFEWYTSSANKIKAIIHQLNSQKNIF